MNHLKSALFGLLFSIPIAYSNAAVAASIVLIQESGAICALPLPVLPNTYVRYNLRRTSSPCDHFNDNVRKISFYEVPSATEVVLGNDEGYPTDGDIKGICKQYYTTDFLVKIKTIKKQTTAENIELDHLPTFSPGIIIAPGLQMVSIDAKSHLRDRLSCISIKISGAPPAPATP